jgi:hypothetical protein
LGHRPPKERQRRPVQSAVSRGESLRRGNPESLFAPAQAQKKSPPRRTGAGAVGPSQPGVSCGDRRIACAYLARRPQAGIGARRLRSDICGFGLAIWIKRRRSGVQSLITLWETDHALSPCGVPDWLLTWRGHRSCANHPVDAGNLSRGERRPGNALRARVASEARPRRRNWGRYAGSRTSAS